MTSPVSSWPAAPLRAKGSAKLLVTALRSLLRFLYLQGLARLETLLAVHHLHAKVAALDSAIRRSSANNFFGNETTGRVRGPKTNPEANRPAQGSLGTLDQRRWSRTAGLRGRFDRLAIARHFQLSLDLGKGVLDLAPVGIAAGRR